MAGGDSQIREVARGSGFMGQNTVEAHFGLGSKQTADEVTVRWPGGKVQTIENVAANQRVTLTEPQ